MKISYIGAFQNMSGYADACRNNIMALTEVGVAVEAVPVSFETFQSDLGSVGAKIKGMVCSTPTCDIQILHVTPNIFHKFIDKSKYNIGYSAWETDKLPPGWVAEINGLDEIWVPSTYNKEVFRTSGVVVPIHVFSHTFNRFIVEQDSADIQLQGYQPDDFVFYTIHQWTSRKNSLAILKAYLTGFTADEKVCLILKTYFVHPGDSTEREKLKQVISEVKARLYLKKYPKILLITDLLSKSQINAIHKFSHCCLSFHCSEGFGIPIAEAMMAAKPVICTGYGGVTDFANSQLMIDYKLTPVYGMPWDTYTGDMTWADINIVEARRKMRWVFEHREEAKQIGLDGQKYIDENLSWSKIGNLMKQRLGEIERSCK